MIIMRDGNIDTPARKLYISSSLMAVNIATLISLCQYYDEANGTSGAGWPRHFTEERNYIAAHHQYKAAYFVKPKRNEISLGA